MEMVSSPIAIKPYWYVWNERNTEYARRAFQAGTPLYRIAAALNMAQLAVIADRNGKRVYYTLPSGSGVAHKLYLLGDIDKARMLALKRACRLYRKQWQRMSEGVSALYDPPPDRPDGECLICGERSEALVIHVKHTDDGVVVSLVPVCLDCEDAYCWAYRLEPNDAERVLTGDE